MQKFTKKYILIKEYPGSPLLHTIAILTDGSSHFKTLSEIGGPFYSIQQSHVLNNPEYWENCSPIEPKQWMYYNNTGLAIIMRYDQTEFYALSGGRIYYEIEKLIRFPKIIEFNIATNKEIEYILKYVAKDKGFKEDSLIHSVINPNKVSTRIHTLYGDLQYDPSDDCLRSSYTIYKKGKWAEIHNIQKAKFGKTEFIIIDNQTIRCAKGDITLNEINKIIEWISNPPIIFGYNISLYLPYEEMGFEITKKDKFTFGCEIGTLKDIIAIRDTVINFKS